MDHHQLQDPWATEQQTIVQGSLNPSRNSSSVDQVICLHRVHSYTSAMVPSPSGNRSVRFAVPCPHSPQRKWMMPSDVPAGSSFEGVGRFLKRSKMLMAATLTRSRSACGPAAALGERGTRRLPQRVHPSTPRRRTRIYIPHETKQPGSPPIVIESIYECDIYHMSCHSLTNALGAERSDPVQRSTE